MTNRPSKSQLLEYLLDKRVNSTLVKVVEAVLIEQPEEPISFMVQHLLDTYPNETASVKASFLAAAAEEAEAEAEAKTEQSVTTRSRCNSISSNTSSGSSGSDLALSISSGSTHTQDGGGGEAIVSSPDTTVEDKGKEEGDLDKHDEGSNGGNTMAMTIEALSSEEQEEEKEEEEETNAENLDTVSASPMDITATSDDADDADNVEDSTADDAEEETKSDDSSPPSTAVAVPRRRTSIAAESIDLSKLRSSIKVVPKTEEESERILQILQQNVLFRHMDDDQLKTVQGAMALVEKKATDTIIQQGDDGDYFYIIDNGEVDVYLKTSTSNCGDSNDEEQQQQLVASYGVGDSFGELAIMYNAPRAASCIARTDVRLWALDRISFKIVAMQTAMMSTRAFSRASLFCRHYRSTRF